MSVSHISPKPWTGRDDPEDGEAAKRLHHFAGDKGRTALIGFACEAGVARNKGRLGAKQGPAALRHALAGLAAPRDATKFADLGDIDVAGDALEAGQEMLGAHVASALAIHDRVIVLGGGHETAFGSFLGLREAYPDKKIGIINLDAHLDLREPGSSGPSSGTPFNQIRMLEPRGFDYLCLGVAAEANTVALIDRAQNWGVSMVMDRELLDDPLSAQPQIAAIAKRNDLLYLTIDIDLMPHYQAPGVSAPAPRGVPFAIVEQLVQSVIAASKQEACALPLTDLVELSPPHDKDNMTAKTAALLVRQLMVF